MNEEEFSLRQHWNEAASKQPKLSTPEEDVLLERMYSFYEQLVSLGWQNAIYCPKDGSHFLVIEAGSIKVCEARYDGEWPTGRWWIFDCGDMWPARPILFKPIPS